MTVFFLLLAHMRLPTWVQWTNFLCNATLGDNQLKLCAAKQNSAQFNFFEENKISC